jgi:hypothetical protein
VPVRFGRRPANIFYEVFLANPINLPGHCREPLDDRRSTMSHENDHIKQKPHDLISNNEDESA